MTTPEEMEPGKAYPLTDAQNAAVDDWLSKGKPSDPASIAAVFGWEYDEGEES